MDIFDNPVIVISVIVWAAAEVSKFIIRRLFGDQSGKLFNPGGMPSAHAAFIAGAATVIALTSGLASPLFGLAVVVAAIVFHDAYRVRWSVGQTADRLNQVISQTKAKTKPVVVWKGHRIREVAAGAVFGVILAWVSYLTLY